MASCWRLAPSRFWHSWWPTSHTALVYTVAFSATMARWNTLAPERQQAWMAWASTNLVNLRSHPVGCLVASAFLTDDRPLAWVVLALVGLSSAGRALGNLRTALAVSSAHFLATFVSEGLLAHRIAAGSQPVADRLVVDVGPSYVVVSALAVGVAYGTWPARVASAIAFAVVAPYLFGGLLHGDVWALGHATAVLVGLALGLPLHRSWRRRAARAR